MFCYKCGEKLPDDSGFCYKCGTKTVKPAQNESDSAPTYSQTILSSSINAPTQRSESTQPSQYQPIQWAHKTSSNVITKNKSKALIFTIIGVLVVAIVIAFICFGHFDFGNGNDADHFINFSDANISNGHTDIIHSSMCSSAFNRCENISVTFKGKSYDYAHIFGLYQAVNKQ